MDILILTVLDGKLNILLSRRKDPPYAGRLALPGRFIGLEEAADTAVRRLLEEMLPLPELFQEQLYTFSDVNRDPRGRVISAAYLVIGPASRLEKVIHGDRTLLRPYAISLDNNRLEMTGEDGETFVGSDLAFDHGRIVETGVLRLRGKIDYTEIGFRFLNRPDAFSMSELQAVFEAVLGTTLDSSNFRRAILGRYGERLRQTAQEERKGRGRPAGLYCLEPEKGGKGA